VRARSAARGARQGERRSGASNEIGRELAGIGLLGLALLLSIALITYSGTEHASLKLAAANRAGTLGAYAASLLLRGFGHGAVVVVVSLLLASLRLIAGDRIRGLSARVWTSLPLLLLASATLPVLIAKFFPGTFAKSELGWLGTALAGRESWLIGSVGAFAVNLLIASAGVCGLFGISVARAMAAVGVGLGWFGAGLLSLSARLGESMLSAASAIQGGAFELAQGFRQGAASLVVWRERRARQARVAARTQQQIEPESPDVESNAVDTASDVSDRDGEDRPKAELRPQPLRRKRGEDPTIVDHVVERAAQVSGRQETFRFEEGGANGNPYRLPEVADIFERPAASIRSYDRESLIMNSRILEKKLADFGIGGQVDKVHPGPVVTMYEFEPASGVKVNRIVGLSDDLALALRAMSVRIIAPLPGKSVVGIEVANAERDIVFLRDVLESEAFRNEPSRLGIALGKDIFGNPTHADLTRMPHLLVAGATGTGKSVFLNSLLCSILSRATPEDLKLLLIDPKVLELSIYEGIPHLIADVVTNPKRAAAALHGIVAKMEERYQMMAALGVRSIAQYNARVEKELAAGGKTFRLKAKPGEEQGKEVEYRKFPYIIVVIDELADLMVVCSHDVEEALQRLAQMARAAGIHLVLATQRPSVDVLTGVIKANFPARIAFQVASRTDSRTILDQNGADHLLGQGDMLFLPPGTAKLKRVHGAFVSEGEVQKLVAFLREQGAPNFDETLIRMKEESETKEARGEDSDDLLDQAIAIVAETRNASISYIQRRLKVGYNRAARMIEQMEQEGIIGPQDGVKPRQVFVRNPDEIDAPE
jgi:S-DNA-T family DNA segregation ATPase FtsK/SpoIIIE